MCNQTIKSHVKHHGESLKYRVILSFIAIFPILMASCAIPETKNKPEATNKPEEANTLHENSNLDENLIMKTIIRNSTNHDLSYVLEHRTITDTSPEEIYTFSRDISSYFEENDPGNLNLAKRLMSKFIEINSQNSSLIMDASDYPKYIVDYDGNLYDSDSGLCSLYVTNPVYDTNTGYVIASLEYVVYDDKYFGPGYIGLYKYENGSLKQLTVIDKEVIITRIATTPAK
jgi:hypothetical protein